MEATVLDNPRAAWTSDDLTQEARAAWYRAAMSKVDEAERNGKAYRSLGFWVGGSGLALALLMGTATTAVYLKKPLPPPPGFVAVDRSSGIIGPAVPAKDAPKLFSEAVSERALREFIVRCEGYIPETWGRSDFHSCAIMAGADEQRRRVADIGRDGPRYPPKVFGPKGWAMPTQFLSFTRLADGADSTLHYEVRYERTEVINGREERPRYTAHVHWQWHPELDMAPADRLLNEGGFVATSFSTTKD